MVKDEEEGEEQEWKWEAGRKIRMGKGTQEEVNLTVEHTGQELGCYSPLVAS